MKKTLKNKMISKLIMMVIPALFSDNSAPPNDATFQTFQDGLSSQGQWIEVNQDEIAPDQIDNSNQIDNSDQSGYVDNDIDMHHVWRPYEAAGDRSWNPYSNGRWVWTDMGWSWVSNYDWGWAPYHYGRWWYSPVYGWVWSPGRTWAHAWVTFYCEDDYIGWYPIAPWSSWYWDDNDVCVENNYYYYTEINNYTYVNEHNFTDPISPRVIIDPRIVPGIGNNSLGTANGNFTNHGPEIAVIQKVTGTKISPVTTNFTGKVSDVGVNNKNITLYKNANSEGNNTIKKTKTETSSGNIGSVNKVPNNQTADKKVKNNSSDCLNSGIVKKVNINTSNVNEKNVQKTNDVNKYKNNNTKTTTGTNDAGKVNKISSNGNQSVTQKKTNTNTKVITSTKPQKTNEVVKQNNNNTKTVTTKNSGMVKQNNAYTKTGTTNNTQTVKKNVTNSNSNGNVNKMDTKTINVTQNNTQKTNDFIKSNNSSTKTVNAPKNNAPVIKENNVVKNNNTVQKTNVVTNNVKVQQKVENTKTVNVKQDPKNDSAPNKQMMRSNVPNGNGKN
jgi:hypothetical protein